MLEQVLNGSIGSFPFPEHRVEFDNVTFSQFSVAGAAGLVSLLRLRFDVASTAPLGQSEIGLSFQVLDSAQSFADLRPQLATVLPSIVTIGSDVQPELTARLETSESFAVPGSEVEVEVLVDLSGSRQLLGAYQAEVSWETGEVELMDVSAGATPEFANTLQQSLEGDRISFSGFNSQGVGGEISLLNLRFRVVGTPTPGSASFDLRFLVLDAAQTFESLLAGLQVTGATVEISTSENRPPVLLPVRDRSVWLITS